MHLYTLNISVRLALEVQLTYTLASWLILKSKIKVKSFLLCLEGPCRLIPNVMSVPKDSKRFYNTLIWLYFKAALHAFIKENIGMSLVGVGVGG